MKEDDGYLEENEEDEEVQQIINKQEESDSENIHLDLQYIDDIMRDNKEIKKAHQIIHEQPLPLIKTVHSLKPDMIFGWKPEADKEIPPIPLCFGLVGSSIHQFSYQRISYIGTRYNNSYKVHERFANKVVNAPVFKDRENVICGPQMVSTYPFQFPKVYDSNHIKYEDAFLQFQQQMENENKLQKQDFETDYSTEEDPEGISLQFDSNFESGNLDFAGQVNNFEYDLLMRLDSNS